MRRSIAAVLAAAALVLPPAVASAQPMNITVFPGAPVRSGEFCDDYARDWANWATERGRDAAVGAIIGGGFGAVLGGALADRPGLGGLIGLGIGAGIGAFADRSQWEAEYNRAYNACIQNSQLAYPWLYNFDGGRYVAGSPEWYNWCTQTYGGNFFPASGQWYNAQTGTYHNCVVP